MNDARVRKTLTLALIAAMLAVSLLHLLSPVSDPDFFWHLKTGEWVWQHRELPSQDPFSYTVPDVPGSREHAVLTSYYLSQLVYYLFYRHAGMSGIVGLRFIIMGLLIFAVTRRREGNGLVYKGLLLIFLTLFLKIYALERPQVFSFFFFAVLLYILERIKNEDLLSGGKKIWYVLLPLVMFFWANTHPGFIVGQATIMTYIVMEGVKFLYPPLRPIQRHSYTRLLICGIAGIVISFANPNTYHVWGDMLLQPAFMVADNVEFQSTYKAFTLFNAQAVILYWFILLLTIAGLFINRKKIDLTELVLLAVTAFFSFITLRYIAVFAIAALPVAARTLSEGRAAKIGAIAVVCFSLAAGAFFSLDEVANVENLKSGAWIDSAYPAAASEFIAANDLKGNMFNYTNWGGYLIWRLAPGKKVFSDGRGLEPNIFKQAILVEIAYRGKKSEKPAWKSILEAHGVKYVVTPFSQPDGTLLPLVQALLKDRDWIPVFFSLNSLVFVENSTLNYDVLLKYSLPKDRLVNALIEVCDMFIKNNPKDIFPYIAKGDLYLIQSRFNEAREAYEEVLRTSPFNMTARERLEFILNARQRGS